MDIRRLLPIMLIVLLLLFILPQLLNRGGSSKTLSSKERSLATMDAIERIDRAELAHLKSKGVFTDELADLLAVDKRLAHDLTVPLSVDLETGSKGRTYYAQASSDVLSVVRARSGKKLTARSCRVVKSKSGVECPQPAPKPGTTTTTAGTTTTG